VNDWNFASDGQYKKPIRKNLYIPKSNWDSVKADINKNIPGDHVELAAFLGALFGIWLATLAFVLLNKESIQPMPYYIGALFIFMGALFCAVTYFLHDSNGKLSRLKDRILALEK
jgi:hypothetical protein